MTNMTSQVQDELWCRHDDQASGLARRLRLPTTTTPPIYGKASQQDSHCHPCNQNEIFQGSHINVATRWRGEEEMDNDHATYVNPLDSL